jgi:hypothetical protein
MSTVDARYGRTPQRQRRTRLIAILAGAGVLIVVVAWVLWVGLFGATAGLDHRDLGYVVESDSGIEVRYEVTMDAGETASCALQALNSDFEIVGWKVVGIPASEDRTRAFREKLNTSEEAVTGLIYRCWLT